MASNRVKNQRKKERIKEKIVENSHKDPCPVCGHEDGCCQKHCQHKILWGK